MNVHFLKYHGMQDHSLQAHEKKEVSSPRRGGFSSQPPFAMHHSWAAGQAMPFTQALLFFLEVFIQWSHSWGDLELVFRSPLHAQLPVPQHCRAPATPLPAGSPQVGAPTAGDRVRRDPQAGMSHGLCLRAGAPLL